MLRDPTSIENLADSKSHLSSHLGPGISAECQPKYNHSQLLPLLGWLEPASARARFKPPHTTRSTTESTRAAIAISEASAKLHMMPSVPLQICNPGRTGRGRAPRTVLARGGCSCPRQGYANHCLGAVQDTVPSSMASTLRRIACARITA